MSTWADPVGDLRTFLADTNNDNLIKEQKVLGVTNGQNFTFYTFQDRLLASGNMAQYGATGSAPLRVFLANAELSASGITVTDQIRGEFQLMVVPSGTTATQGTPLLRTSYHFRQSLDTELNTFLTQAGNMTSQTDINNVPQGLQTACIYLAASMAHMRLAQRWQLRKSEQFMLQDEPMRQEAENLIAFHQNQAKELQAMGLAMRKDYYNLRQDRGLAPAFGLLNRVPNPYTPRR